MFFLESITFTGTKAKTLLALNIIDKLIKMDVDDAVDTVMNTSLMEDAARDFGNKNNLIVTNVIVSFFNYRFSLFGIGCGRFTF